MSRFRLALLTSARTWRGSGVSLGKIARGLADRGHQVQLLVGEARVARTFAALGLPVSVTPTGNTGWAEIRTVRRSLRGIGAEAVLVDRLRDLRLASWATVGTEAAVIYRHNVNSIGPRPRLTDRLALARTRLCLFQSERVRQAAVAGAPSLGRLRGRVVYNGYDTGRYARNADAAAAFRARYGLGPDRLLALTISALEPAKGHQFAIEALARARQQGVELTYVVSGEGPVADELRQRSAAAGIPLCLTGFLEGDDLVAALSAADLYLHPSLEELLPNAVGEAMACACAIVASDVGGTAELLGTDGSAGLLVPAASAEAMAAAIGCLAADADHRQRLGRAARARVEQEFPLRRMIDGYEAAVLEAVRG
jgi:glycosyltransferase involved in cell wall biosynthesis